MSSIDERIVQMTFDNESFEKNVHTTLGTLDQLNGSLDNLGTASNISNTLDDISSRFSNLGIIGVTALTNITNKAVDAGLKLASSLTIDQVSAGFEKYTSSTKDIKALLNSTGEDIDTVTSQIKDLNWYSDATSYSYSAMVTALKSFAAQDISVDEAIPMIMGIGNSLSYAGLAAENASGAFNIYSKAIGQGYMSQIQWKSLNLMGAATADLKQKYIDAALALGTLTKESDGSIKTLNGLEVSVANFDSTLSNQKGKWLTTDVLKAVLGVDYGTYSTNLKSFSDGFNELAKSEIDVINQMSVYDVLVKDLNENYKAIETTQPDGSVVTTWEKSAENAAGLLDNFKEFKDAYEKATGAVLTDQEAQSAYDNLMTIAMGMNDAASVADTYSKKSFLAAQEARTFGEAVNAVKDAASSAWSSIFQNVFGNAEQATELWSNFSTWLYDVFMAPTLLLSNAVAKWNELGGRTELIDAFSNIAKVLSSIAEPIKKAFNKIFGEFSDKTIADNIYNLTVRFKEFTNKLILTEDEGNKLQKIFEGVFAVFDSVKIVVTKVVTALKPLATSILKPIFEFAVKAAEGIANFAIAVRDYLKEHTGFENAIGSLAGIFESFKNGVTSVSDVIEKVIGKIVEWGKKIFDTLKSCFGENSLSVTDIAGLGIGLSYILKVFKSLKDASNLGGLIGKLKEALNSVSDAIDAFAAKQKMEALRQLAVSMLILAGAMLIMASIDSEKFGQAIAGIAAAAAAAAVLVVAMAALDKIINKKSSGGKGGFFGVLTETSKIAGLIAIAGAILILAAAAKIFASMSWEELAKAGTAIVVLMAAFAGFLKLMENIDIKKMGSLIALAAALLIVAAAAKIFGSMDWEQLGKAGVAIAGFMAIAAIFFKIVEGINAGKLIAISAALLIFSASILVLAAGLLIFQMLDFDKMANSLIIIASAIVIFGVASLLLSSAALPMLAIAAAMLVFSASILVLAVALGMMTLVDTAKLATVVDGIIAPLLALGTISLILGVISPLMLTTAIGMAALGASLIVLAAGFGALQLVDMENLLSNIGKVCIAMLELGGVSIVLGVLSPLLVLTAAGVAALAGSLILLATAFAALGGLDSLALGIIVAALVVIVAELILIDAELVVLIAAVIAVAAAVVAADVALIGLVATAGLAAASLALMSLSTNGIADNMTKFGESIATIPDKTDKAYRSIETFCKDATSKIKNLQSEFKNVGKNCGQGLIDGLTEKKSAAKTAAYDLGQELLKSIKKSLEIKSPSKAFAEVGGFADKGLAVGLDKYSSYATNAAKNLGEETTYALAGSFQQISDLVENDPKIIPTVEPVLDLSELQNGKRSLDGILNTSGINASITGYTEATSADANFLADQISQLRLEMQNLKFENTGIGSEIKNALAGMGIYMNGNKVGNMVSQYQGNVRRATGN